MCSPETRVSYQLKMKKSSRKFSVFHIFYYNFLYILNNKMDYVNKSPEIGFQQYTEKIRVELKQRFYYNSVMKKPCGRTES